MHQLSGERPCITKKIHVGGNKAILLCTLQLGLEYTNLMTYCTNIRTHKERNCLTSLNRGNTDPNNFGNCSSIIGYSV